MEQNLTAIDAKDASPTCLVWAPAQTPQHDNFALGEHLQRIGIPAPGKEYIIGAQATPARRVGTCRKRNIILEVPAPHLNVVLQAESASGEYYFLLDQLRRVDIAAVFDQPTTLPVEITKSNGVRGRAQCTADYLVVYADRVVAYEVKKQADLDELCVSRSVDWVRDNDTYHYLPAEKAFGQLGIEYRVFPANQITNVCAANLRLLARVRHVKDSTALYKERRRALEIVRARGCIQMRDLLDRLETVDTTAVMQLLDRGDLQADLDRTLLSHPDYIWVAVSREEAVLLEDSNHQFEQALRSAGLTSEEVIDPKYWGAVARRWLICTQPDELIPDTIKPSDRTCRRLRALFARGGGDIRALVPNWNRCGNHHARYSSAHRALVDSQLRQARSDPDQSTIAAGIRNYLVAHSDFCRESGIDESPISSATIYRYARQGVHPSEALTRGGRRLANAGSDPSDPATRSLLATTPFSVAHIDHWQMDLHALVGDIGGKKRTRRPWLTAMVDAFSGELLAYSMSFQSPSRDACSLVIRDCVRRHGRVPEMIVTDSGADFTSTHFIVMLATLGITWANRPPEDPRFGKEVERVFGTFKERFARGLPGFCNDIARAREQSSSANASKRAKLRLHQIWQIFEAYAMEGYNNAIRSGGNLSPVALRDSVLASHPFCGIKCAWDLALLILTSVEAPSKDYRVWPGKGIRVRDRVFTCPELSVHRGSTRRLVVRMEPLDRSICYVQVGNRWLVCRDGTASVSQGIPDIEVAASALEGEELRSALRRAYLDAEITLHELKLARLPAELHETTARLAKPKPSTPPAAASALTRPKNLEEVPLLPVRPEQQP